MSVDSSTPRSRRAILASALGGLGAIAAARLIKPQAASAAPGDAVLVDAAHSGAGTTSIVTSSTTGPAVSAISADGPGLKGASTDAVTSLFPDNSHRTGVVGIGGDETSMAINTDEVGVYGWSDAADHPEFTTGVWGDTFNGTGVYGT